MDLRGPPVCEPSLLVVSFWPAGGRGSKKLNFSGENWLQKFENFGWGFLPHHFHSPLIQYIRAYHEYEYLLAEMGKPEWKTDYFLLFTDLLRGKRDYFQLLFTEY
jgi:hypothetical protein